MADEIALQGRPLGHQEPVKGMRHGEAGRKMESSPSHAVPWWNGSNTSFILEVILRTSYVEPVLKSSIELRVGRTLSRVGKSNGC